MAQFFRVHAYPGVVSSLLKISSMDTSCEVQRCILTDVVVRVREDGYVFIVVDSVGEHPCLGMKRAAVSSDHQLLMVSALIS